MNAMILSIGDELVLGQTVDTNSAWISQQLAAVGCDIAAHVTVPDDQSATERAMIELSRQCDFLICSGGIGPTPDDLTRQALAVVLGVELETSEFWTSKLTDFFQKRGRPMPEMNKIQAMIPRGAKLIDNTAGTAAGIEAVIWSDAGHACRVFVMPGVPKEMKAMFTRDVLPHVRQAGGGAVVLSRTLHTFGLGESAVAEKLGALMDRKRQPSVGTTVSNRFVSLRVNSRFGSREEAEKQLEQTCVECRTALGDLIFGQDEQSLSEAVAAIVPVGCTIATAEVGTSGLLAKMLTDTPASERFYLGGQIGAHRPEMVDPSARAKADALDIRMTLNSTLGVAALCDASGGAAIAISSPRQQMVRSFNFAGDRESIRDRTAKMALTMLRLHLLAKPLPW
jgi:nicotinamide-nucleotide amidase